MTIQSFRVAIQRVNTSRKSAYRLIAYGGDAKAVHAYFEDFETLLAALHSVTVEIDELVIRSEESRSDGSSVIFSGELKLSALQRRALGLIPERM